MRTKSLFVALGAALLLGGCSLEGVVESMDDTPKCSSSLAKSIVKDLVFENVLHLDENQTRQTKLDFEIIYATSYDPLVHSRECVASVELQNGKDEKKYMLEYSIQWDEVSKDYIVALDKESLEQQIRQNSLRDDYINFIRSIILNKNKDHKE